MPDAKRCAPCLLDPISQGYPSLRHVKQRNLAPGLVKLLSDLEAVGCVQPVAGYDFAGRHPPSPVRLFTQAATTAVCSYVAKKIAGTSQDLMSVAHNWARQSRAERRQLRVN